MRTYRKRSLGELVVEGDRACANGDRVALTDIAWELVERTREPVHCELVALADRCADPYFATAAWGQLKGRVQQVAS